MPSFTVDVDLEVYEILASVPNDALIEELEERGLKVNFTNDVEKLDLLRDSSGELRRAGKLNLALGIDSLIEELNL